MFATRRIAYVFTIILLLAGAAFTGAVQAGQTLDVRQVPGGVGCVTYNNVDPLTPWWLAAATEPTKPVAETNQGSSTVDCNLAEDPVPIYAVALAASPFLLPLALLLIIGPGRGPSRQERRAAKAAAKAAAAQVAADTAARKAQKAQAEADKAVGS